MNDEINEKTDAKWFEYLLEREYLPKEAIRKIESDKRRGIEPPKMPYEFSSSVRENWWAIGAFGAIGLAILYLRFKGAPK